MGTAGALAAGLGLSVVGYANLWKTFRRSVRFRPSDGRLRRMNELIALQTLIRSDDDEVERFVHQAVQKWREYRYRGRSGLLSGLPHHTRLAFEMALHEEDERRALEGEL